MWSIRGLEGEHYKSTLQRFHTFFMPQTYLEIGVQNGLTLELASCASIAIDPEFHIGHLKLNGKPSCLLYQMTSDVFFKAHSPSAIFGQPIEMAFLDGMHYYEFLLRDFMNVEAHSRKNSIIFLHDCVPLDEHVGRRNMHDGTLRARSAQPDWWAGDVWKTVAILTEVRPDLRIYVFDSEPTGLVAITHLDQDSTVLSDRYYDLVEAYKDRTLDQAGDAFYAKLRILRSADYTEFGALSSLFWL